MKTPIDLYEISNFMLYLHSSAATVQYCTYLDTCYSIIMQIFTKVRTRYTFFCFSVETYIERFLMSCVHADTYSTSAVGDVQSQTPCLT